MTTKFNMAGTRLYVKLEGMVRYAGELLAPAEGFGLRPRLLSPCPL